MNHLHINTNYIKEERFGGIFRQVFFSPETTGKRYLKMAYIDVPPGATGTPHVHLGEELVYNIRPNKSSSSGDCPQPR